MRNLISALCLVLVGTPVFACLGEAQILAKVGSFNKTTTSCKVYPNESTVKIYNENGTCPLDLGLVLAKGIEVGFADGHDCRLNNGDTLTGVLVLKPSGTIILE